MRVAGGDLLESVAAPAEIEWRQLMRIGGGGDENTQIRTLGVVV